MKEFLKNCKQFFFSGYFYKVSREGSGLKRVWLQHFQQFRNVSSDMASAIVTVYPSPQSLLQVQSSSCNIWKLSPFAGILIINNKNKNNNSYYYYYFSQYMCSDWSTLLAVFYCAARYASFLSFSVCLVNFRDTV